MIGAEQLEKLILEAIVRVRRDGWADLSIGGLRTLVAQGAGTDAANAAFSNTELADALISLVERGLILLEKTVGGGRVRSYKQLRETEFLDESAIFHQGSFRLRLTHEGRKALSAKDVGDLESSRVIFLSHAAVDEEIAKYLKEILEEAFPTVDVFVSSDPEDLPPGSRWVETILAKLASASMVLVLSTERGLSRRWVWFETGAGWSRNLTIIPCCIGSRRKGNLSQPFSDYQSLNADEEGDFRILVDLLAKKFGAPSQLPDFPIVVSQLTRLDVRADERARVNEALSYSSEIKAQVEEELKHLNEGEKEALRLLFREGEATDSRAIRIVREKGLLKDNPTHIFTRINHETGFVRRVWPPNKTEQMLGYQGPWTLNEHLKPILEGYLFPGRHK